MRPSTLRLSRYPARQRQLPQKLHCQLRQVLPLGRTLHPGLQLHRGLQLPSQRWGHSWRCTSGCLHPGFTDECEICYVACSQISATGIRVMLKKKLLLAVILSRYVSSDNGSSAVDHVAAMGPTLCLTPNTGQIEGTEIAVQ